MNPNYRILALVLLLVLLTASSCNMPGEVPRQAQNQTPDLTITALSAFISTAQAAQTGVPIQEVVPTETATPLVLATAQPTASLAPTAIPTEGPEPTEAKSATEASGSVPSKRSKSSISATYLQTEPVIDGNFDEWDLTPYDVDEIAYGDNRLGNEKDLSGTVMVGWDDFYLYIAADVRDDNYDQRAGGKYLFRGDGIEFLLDTDVSKDFYVRSLNSDDFQVGISPGKNKPGEDTEAYLWYPKSKAGRLNEVDAAAKETDNGYRLEARIPWDLFDITPDGDMHFGFAFSISDNDKSNENVQQSMLSTVGGRRLTDPTTWGDLVLEGHE